MEYLRSKEIKKVAEKTSAILDETDVSNASDIVNPIVWKRDLVAIGESIMKDVDLSDWIKSFAETHGGKHWIHQVLQNPTYNVATIGQRTRAVSFIKTYHENLLNEIGTLESSVLWLLRLPSPNQAWPMPMLFPSWPVIKHLNTLPVFLMLLHAYKGYISPCMNIFYPLSTIFGPFFYIRKTLKWKISLATYMHMLKLGITTLMKPSTSIKQNASKYFTLVTYVIVFVYGVIQSFDLASMIRAMRSKLLEKSKRIHRFVEIAKDLVRSVPNTLWKMYGNKDYDVDQVLDINVAADLSGMYTLWTNQQQKLKLQNLLELVYIIDVVCGSKKAMLKRGWAPCKFGQVTKFWGMGHPLLANGQVRNPASLEKNVIITGPNAAGKTTYMKAICANILLSHSFGFACCKKAIVQPLHAIGSFVRVHDSVGKESLFEAELRRCADIVNQARDISLQGKAAVYFLDEPMHSTPPLEGAATAMGVADYLGNLPGVRLFVTTHYHQMTSLEKMQSNTWTNVSMTAYQDKNGTYMFPYVLGKGPSFQCIALEILQDHSLPEDVIQSAIKMKNKICEALVEDAS
jgi:hypothetical protein